ncbi:hypothetical protein AC249_AIPGENE22761 [Exaiptasia diaphana]|nr:hypothetical protein AC249_AIPGENE22761 [Exaiptasia diaphana]
MDIFVIRAEEVRGKINVSGTAKTLHKVDKNANLEEIKMLLRSYNVKDAVFVPLKELYWMKKGTKQCVALQSDSDLAKAIGQYGSTNLCLACGTLSLQDSSDSSSKRKLEYDGEKRDEEGFGKKGKLWRYSHKHLKLWTDDIVEGRSYGIGAEPDWTAHIDKVVTPPKTSRGAALSGKQTHGMPSSTIGSLPPVVQPLPFQIPTAQSFSHSLPAFIKSPLNQMSTDPCTSSSLSTSMQPTQSLQDMPSPQEKSRELSYFSLQQCCDFLGSLGLSHHISKFQDNNMDGQLLSAFALPNFGKVMLESMGFSLEEQQTLVDVIAFYKSPSPSCDRV